MTSLGTSIAVSTNECSTTSHAQLRTVALSYSGSFLHPIKVAPWQNICGCCARGNFSMMGCSFAMYY